MFLICFLNLNIDLIKLGTGFDQAIFTMKKFMDIDWSIFASVMKGMLTSITIAFTATVISTCVALPISFLAASNLTWSNRISTFLKAFVAILRSVPTLVWGLMVIASMGFGNIGGVLTLVFILNCFLIRSFTASIEEVGTDIIEALKSSGSPWICIAVLGILPMAFSSMLAWIAISFEMAVSASISLGMIGVTGVGKILISSLSQYKYGQVTVGILVIFVTMYIVEMSTIKVKRALKKG